MPSIEDMSAARQRGAAADAMMEEALLAALPPQDIAAVNAQRTDSQKLLLWPSCSPKHMA